MTRRHVLVGSGPAAIAAAEAIRSADAEGRITIVGEEAEGYYSRPGLAYHLAREIPEDRLSPFAPRDFSELGIARVDGHVTAIDRAAHTVTLADRSSLPYDRLLLATGSRAIPIDVPGAELDGVIKLDDLGDARDLIRRARRAKAAVVMGGGITAIEIVEGLLARKVRVHYLMRKDRYWGDVLSEAESDAIEDGLRAQGVTIHPFTELARIQGRDGRVAGIATVGGETIACDIVGVAIGVLPRTELARAAGLPCERGVLVDAWLRTEDPDIFAAGDLAETTDAATGRHTVEVLWNSAVAKGRVAGANMALDEPARTYEGLPPLNVTRLAGYKVTIIGSVGGFSRREDADVRGISRGDSDAWRVAGTTTVEGHEDDCRIRLELGVDRIAGAVVMGDQALSFPLQGLVTDRVDVSAIVARLLEPGAPVGEIIRGFWEERDAERSPEADRRADHA